MSNEDVDWVADDIRRREAARALETAQARSIPEYPNYGEYTQPAPVPNRGRSMHDLVIEDILSRDPRWDLSVGTARHIRDRVAADLDARKQHGRDKYGALLQAGNGRNPLVDLIQELLDGAVYARQGLAELEEASLEASLEYAVLFEIYDDIVTDLVKVRRMLDARTAATE